MPSLKSNKNKWSLPTDPDPTGVRCISVPVPDDPEWIAKFFGAIYTLSQQIWWDRDDAHTAQLVARRWAEVYVAALNSVCAMTDCDDCLGRIERDPQTGWYGFRPTGSTEFYRFPDGPWGTSVPDPIYPPPQAWEGGTDENKRCVASRNAALVLKSLYNETWQSFINWSVGGAFSFIRDVLQTFGEFFNAVMAFDWMLEKAQELHAAEADFADQFDDGEFELLQGILYCHSAVDTDGVVTFDYDAVVADFVAQGTSPFPGLVFLVTLYLQEDGLNTAGGIHNEDTADCSDAPCLGEWCYNFDFTAGQQGWSPVAGKAVWYLGNQWAQVNSGGGTELRIKHDLPAGTYTMTSVRVVGNNSAGAAPSSAQIAEEGNPLVQIGLTPQVTGAYDTTYTGSAVFTAGTDIRLDYFNASPVSNFLLYRIELRGTGVNPFGADNCV